MAEQQPPKLLRCSDCKEGELQFEEQGMSLIITCSKCDRYGVATNVRLLEEKLPPELRIRRQEPRESAPTPNQDSN